MRRFMFAAIGIASVALFASAAPRVPAQDVAVVNAKTIRIKLDNSRARVMEATLKPGEKEAMHSHPPYLIYVLAGGKVRNHNADGTTAEATYAVGDTIYREPLTHWSENIGATTIRLLLVELKQR
jgi:quercetin dioxygenase-like cupin family protein